MVESKVKTAPILTTAGLDELILLLTPFDKTPKKTSNNKGQTQTTVILHKYHQYKLTFIQVWWLVKKIERAQANGIKDSEEKKDERESDAALKEWIETHVKEAYYLLL